MNFNPALSEIILETKVYNLTRLPLSKVVKSISQYLNRVIEPPKLVKMAQRITNFQYYCNLRAWNLIVAQDSQNPKFRFQNLSKVCTIIFHRSKFNPQSDSSRCLSCLQPFKALALGQSPLICFLSMENENQGSMVVDRLIIRTLI